MVSGQSRSEIRVKKHNGVHNRSVGTVGGSRPAALRSNNYIYAQIIDGTAGNTLVAIPAAEKEVDVRLEKTNNKAAAAYVGIVIAKRALERGIKEVALDRDGSIYQGKVQTLADVAYEAGLDF